MRSRQNILKVVFPNDTTFAAVRKSWPAGFVAACLTRLWVAWDDLLLDFKHRNVNPSTVDWTGVAQKERSLAYLHSMQAINRQCVEDPFLFRPEAHEMESLSSARAMPPSYDFAFYLRGGNFRIALPVEAKYLSDADDVQRLCSDLTDKYMSGTGAPLTSIAGILGYILSGSPQDAFHRIEAHISCKLDFVPEFPSRDHRLSRRHKRLPPASPLDCHWLLCGWD
jgi:hypothetical protein